MTILIRAIDQAAPVPRDVLQRFTCDGIAHGLFPPSPFERTGAYTTFRTAASRAGWKVTDLGLVLGPCCSGKAIEASE